MHSFVPLYTDISGNAIGVNKYIFGEGKVKGISLQGGVHGGEVTYFIFHSLFYWLKKNEHLLLKEVCLMPLINPPAWNQRIYYYTVGKFDFYKGKDWNRSYSEEGMTLSARNSEKIFQISSEYPLVLDLHTARISKPYAIFQNLDLTAELKSLGFFYNIYSNPNNGKRKGMLSEALAEKNKRGITLECGSHDDYSEENITEVFESILRLFEQQEIIPKNILQQKEVPVVNKVEKINVIFNKISGFVKYEVSSQSVVQKGQLLATVYPSDSLEKTEEVLAPYDGVIFEIAKSHIAWVGDELFRIIPKGGYSVL